jgi:hypothetical protein
MDHHYPAPLKSTSGRLAQLDHKTHSDDEGDHALPLHLSACCSLRYGFAGHYYGLVAIGPHNFVSSRARLEEALLLSWSTDMCVRKGKNGFRFTTWPGRTNF